MGTPDFAVPALQALYKEHEVVAVYTQAPKASGRGHLLTLSPVHQTANQLNIKVYTPKTLRKLEAQQEFMAINADCAVVAAYGLILPKEILDACPHGCINLHPSLLPAFRGAAPMQRSILAGVNETAMCIMQMDEGIDTGDILMINKIALDKKITYQELSKRMSILGANMLLEVLANLKNIKPIKQSGTPSYAEKLNKEEALLDWSNDSEFLVRKVRALNPWPGTYFEHKGERIKVLSAESYDIDHNNAVGSVSDNLMFYCAKGAFTPLILQRSGKKALALKEFLKGWQIL
jgi:methionyl-tRNA formyltransferase